MANITFSSSDLQEARNFLIQYLRDANYLGSLNEGTAANDILVRGMSLLYQLFKYDVQRASAYLSLARAQELQTELGTEYDTVVDAILSNWFVTRKQGDKAFGTLRLFFSKPVGFLEINQSQALALIGGEVFYPAADTVLTPASFTSIVNAIEHVTEFYVDILVRAANPSDVEVKAGAEATSYLTNVFFLRSEVPDNFYVGSTVETSEEFITRTRKVITTREMITDRAINTVLLDAYLGIQNLYIAGYGSTEQMRDVVQFDLIDVHVGNKADIYVKQALEKKEQLLQVVDGKVSYLGISDGIDSTTEPVVTQLAGIVSLMTAEDPDAEPDPAFTPQPVAYTLSNTSETTWACYGKLPDITPSGVAEGSFVTLTYLTDSVVDSVHAFVYAEENRVVCYDPVVKTLFPVCLSGTLTLRVSVALGQTLEEIAASARAVVKNHINTIPPGSTLILSDLIKEIHQKVPGLLHVVLPATLSYSLFDPLSLTEVTGSISDKFAIPESLSKQISWNTLQFYTDSDFLTLQLEEY
ncbi:MAG: hypothetical protein LHW56_01660 [Candidatus Cloacimonetes bacterium]|nr:hypothetical protein [Candidatus Cloacimonadota bacterium]MDY0171594.1 hypothetical protein [Candidatus Cloacimonadaceae bacterium]